MLIHQPLIDHRKLHHIQVFLVENLQLNDGYDDHQRRIQQIQNQIFRLVLFQTHIVLPTNAQIQIGPSCV